MLRRKIRRARVRLRLTKPRKTTEAKRATADAQQALNALAADEDGRFLDCVQEFVDAYDSIVDERSYSLADLDIDASDLAPRLRSEFECKVVQADVYNGMAWVDIDVTSKNIASAVDSFAREVAGDALSYDDEDAYRAHLKEALLDSIDKQKPRTVRVRLRSSRAMMGGKFRKATWNRCSVRHGVHSEF